MDADYLDDEFEIDPAVREALDARLLAWPDVSDARLLGGAGYAVVEGRPFAALLEGVVAMSLPRELTGRALSLAGVSPLPRGRRRSPIRRLDTVSAAAARGRGRRAAVAEGLLRPRVGAAGGRRMTGPDSPGPRGTSREEFVAAMARIAESVYDFHSRFGLPMLGAGLSPEQGLETLRTRLPYLVEEIGEHSKALNNDDLDDALPELADVAFVAAGSVLTMGVPAALAACRDVALKNDAKTHDTHYLEASSGKVLRRPRRDVEQA